MSSKIIENVAGVIGTLCAITIHMSGMKTFRRILKIRNVESFSFLPYLSWWCNCVMWLVYFTVKSSRKLALPPLVANGFGFILHTFYLVIFFKLNTKNLRYSWTLLVSVLLTEFIIIGFGIFIIDEWNPFPFNGDKLDQKLTYFGIFTFMQNIGGYAGPCANLRSVFENKSVEHMPLPLSLFGLFNGILWGVWGYSVGDMPMMAASCGGIFFGALQVSFWCWYRGYDKIRNLDDDDEKQVEPVTQKRKKDYKKDYRSITVEQITTLTSVQMSMTSTSDPDELETIIVSVCPANDDEDIPNNTEDDKDISISTPKPSSSSSSALENL